ncbi:MAG: DMT family transporter [Sphaerochaetaceae bacterium]
MNSEPDRNRNLSLLLGLCTVVLWSSGFVFTRIAVKELSPYSVSLIRYGSAAAVLFLIALFKKIGLPRVKDIPLFFAIGATGFALYQILFNFAMITINSAVSSIIMATVPVIAALYASAVFKEKLGKIGWFAVAVEFGGIIILATWKREVSIGFGLVLMVIAALFFAVYNILQRFSTKDYTPLQSTAYSMIAGALLLIIFIPRTIREVAVAPLQPLLAALFMGIIPSAIGFLFWTKALSIATHMSDVTNFMFVTPILATLLEILILKEYPDVGTIIGGVVILFGVLIFNNRVKIGTLKRG